MTTQRTREEIEADLASARAAYNSMANQTSGSSSQSKGKFLDNCSRRIQELLTELRALDPS